MDRYKINLKSILFSSADLRIKLIKLLDYIIGGLICHFLSPRFPAYEFSAERVLVIRPGGIGDAVLTIPFLYEIKRILNAEIDVLADLRNREIFDLESDLIKKVYCYNQGSLFSTFFDLRARNYDIIFDTEQWHNLSAVLANFIGAKAIIGFNTRTPRSKLYTHRIVYTQKEYEAYNFLNLLAVFKSAAKELSTPFLHYPQIEPFCFKSSKKKIVFCLSASIRERKWPDEYILDFINRASGLDFLIVLIGGKKEENWANELVGDKSQIISLAGRLNIKETIAVLKGVDLFIGFDSGINHLANGLGLKTISLFGPGIKEKWGSPFKNQIVISKNLPCSPCTVFGYTPYCERGIDCTRQISVDEVLRTMENLLDE